MLVAAGYEGKIDFTLSPVTTVRVSGVLTGLPKEETGMLVLTPRTQQARPYLNLIARAGDDGAFSIANVPAGAYMLAATSDRNGWVGRAAVDVATSDIEGVQIQVEAPLTVTGTIHVESKAEKKPEGAQSTLFLRPADPMQNYYAPVQTKWDDARTQFSIVNVAPGNYHVEFASPPPFYVRRIAFGDQDIDGSAIAIGPGGAIDIYIADDGGSIEGDVSADDVPVAAWIVLQRDGGEPCNTRADDNGHFRMDALPPGDYKVSAWDDNTKVEYANPDWMQRHAKSVSVTVAAGATAQIKLNRQIAPTS